MGQRLELHELLKAIMGNDNVYFQPPPSIQMHYPCIIYSRDSADTKYANDFPYLVKRRYMITIIDRNPDSEIPDKVSKLMYCRYSRHYKVDNLNHDVFNIYF